MPVQRYQELIAPDLCQRPCRSVSLHRSRLLSPQDKAGVCGVPAQTREEDVMVHALQRLLWCVLWTSVVRARKRAHAV